MYLMHDLLQLLNSDGADALRIRIGSPPVIILQDETQPLEGPEITAEDAERLLQSVSTTRQRRELRECGHV